LSKISLPEINIRDRSVIWEDITNHRRLSKRSLRIPSDWKVSQLVEHVAPAFPVPDPSQYYMFIPSTQIIMDPEKELVHYRLDPSRKYTKNYFEFRVRERKIKLFNKTKFEGVISTKDFHVSDYASVSDIVENLTKIIIPEVEHKNYIFKKFEKPVFLLDPQSFLNNQCIPEVIPFVLVKNHSFEEVMTIGGLRSTSSEDLNALVRKPSAVGEAHQFEEVFFEKPTWCKFCTKFIWGIVGKQGFRCKTCQYTVHKKCVLKAPFDCHKGAPRKTIIRQGTHGVLATLPVPSDSQEQRAKHVILAIQIPSMEGYLLLKTPKKWKARYFRLEEDKLAMFKTHEDMNVISFYTVYQMVSVDVPRASEKGEDKMFRITYRTDNGKILEERLKPSDELDTTLRLWLYHLKEWLALESFFTKQFELSKTSLFSYLPKDILIEIFAECNTKTIAMVCKSWYIMMRDQEAQIKIALKLSNRHLNR